MRVTGNEVRELRKQLGERQAVFAARFGKTRRTQIRWEQEGTRLSDYMYPARCVKGEYLRDQSEVQVWLSAKAEASERAAQAEHMRVDDPVLVVEWMDDNGHHSHLMAEQDARDMAAELVALGARRVFVFFDLLTGVKR